MIDIAMQFTGQGLRPTSPEGLDTLKNTYKNNEPVRCKCTKMSKAMEASVEQNNLLYSCFQIVADNAPMTRLNTKEKVKFCCKVSLDYRHQDRVAIAQDGSIIFEYRSFGFAELRDMERLNVFDRAFEFCASALKISVDELVAEAKSRMYKHV